MTTTTTNLDSDLERLKALLDDLSNRAFRPGLLPYQGMQELGKFVEEVHTALGNCLGFDSLTVLINGWHTELKRHDYDCHAKMYSSLDVVYDQRNIASHPNAELHQITYDQVERRYGDICDKVPDLVRRLTKHSLVDFIFDVQRCSQRQFRAEKLRAAIATIGPPEDYLPVVIEYAAPYIDGLDRFIARIPQQKQLGRVVTSLGKHVSAQSTDLLRQLADQVLRRTPHTVNRQPLEDWIRQYGEPWEPGTAPKRARMFHVHMIRLTLDRDPRLPAGLLLKNATVVDPVIPRLAEALPEFPIPLAGVEQLYDVTSKLLRIIATVRHNLSDSGSDELHSWKDFVLDIEAPVDLISTDFESIGPARPGRNFINFTNLFRCVTIRPLFEYEPVALLRGVEQPLIHPRNKANSVAVWGTNDPEQLYLAAQGHDCLFTGPLAWSKTSIPPVVEAFEGFPGAIVCQADDELNGVDPLFDGEDQRQWPDILDRVTSLRRSKNLIKVLWNDPNYEPMLAESV